MYKIIKRVILIFCILNILQSSLYNLKNIAIAVENEVQENIVQSDEEDEELIEETEDEELENDDEEETEETSLEVAVSSENSSVYKGYLYANSNSDVGYEQSYNSIEEITITNSSNIDKILFKETDNIILTTGDVVELNDAIYYQETRVYVQDFEDILGVDGEIQIYDGDGNYLGSLSSESEIENDYYIFEYDEQYNNIIFDIENPISDGTIEIYNDKAIKEDIKFNKDAIELFDSINVTANFSMFCGEEATNYEAVGSILLKETESKMTIEIDNSIWSTEYENTASINISLKTDSERYELFTNPIIEIEFPSEVQSVDITGLNLLYKNGLSLGTREVYTNENGNIVLRITLTGSQLLYAPGSATEGTVIAMDLNIVNNKLTTNGTDYLKMTYTNEASDRIAYLLEGKTSEDLEIEFVGKEEIITAIYAINQTNESSNITYDGETSVIDIDLEGEEQTISVTGTMLNNFSSSITNVYVIGKIPFTENVNTSGYSYGTTFDTTLASAISTSGIDVEIYYSEEENPNADSESWTTDTSDVTKYKTFKIVINSYEINAGDYLSFSYDISVPENVGYNAVGYGDYTIYYDYDGQEQYSTQPFKLVSEEKELSLEDINEENIVEVTTNSEENETVENESNDTNQTEDNSNNEETESLLTIGYKVTQGTTDLTEEDTVFERQIIKYTIVVENTSNTTINNLVIKGNAENANMYTYVYYTISDLIPEEFTVRSMEEITDGSVTYDELDVESLSPGETVTFSYYVMTLELENDNMVVAGNITISSDEITEQTIQTFSNEIVDSEVSVVLKTNGTEGLDDEDYYTGGIVEFEIYFENIADYDLENFIVVLEFSNGFYYEEPTSDIWFEGNEDYNYYTESSGSNNNLVIEIPYLEKGATEEIYIRLCTNSVDLNIDEITYTLLAYVETSNNKYYSNDFTRTYSQGETEVESTWVSDSSKETVEDGDIITFTFQMKNTGILDAATTITPYFSEGYRLVSASYKINDDDSVDVTINDNSIFISDSLMSGDEITVTIVASVDENYFIQNQKVVEARLSVTGDLFESFFTDVISYKIATSTNNETTTPSVEATAYAITSSNSQVEPSNSSTASSVSVSETSTTTNSTTSRVSVYSISGTVWLDSNKDGIMDGEDGVKDIDVILYKAISGEGIDTSSKIDETTTDSDGKYSFTDVEIGSYVIVFEYDNEIYAVTEYQTSKAIQAESSDATSKTLTTGEIVAITDTLEISDSDLININLGLVLIKTFDLSLEQYVTNILITNDNGKTNYEYNNETDTKIEVSQKYYTSTVLEITYKIVITNEGDATGYVNKIVDYLPDDVELADSNWYEGEDGNVYNTQLLGSEIESGTSRTISLTVKKSLANGEAARIVNIAEIAESTNSYGLDDIDSTVFNKDTSEDDYSETTIIVSISTGLVKSVIMVISLITFIGVCVFVCFYIKKYYNKKRFIK